MGGVQPDTDTHTPVSTSHLPVQGGGGGPQAQKNDWHSCGTSTRLSFLVQLKQHSHCVNVLCERRESAGCSVESLKSIGDSSGCGWLAQGLQLVACG